MRFLILVSLLATIGCKSYSHSCPNGLWGSYCNPAQACMQPCCRGESLTGCEMDGGQIYDPYIESQPPIAEHWITDAGFRSDARIENASTGAQQEAPLPPDTTFIAEATPPLEETAADSTALIRTADDSSCRLGQFIICAEPVVTEIYPAAEFSDSEE